MTLNQGQILNNRYRIAKLLGESDSAAVYRTWDLNTNSPCILEEILESPTFSGDQFVLLAQQLYKVQHPNLPRIMEAFSLKGRSHYLVVELVEGQDLEELLAKEDGAIPEGLVLPWVVQACDALIYLHNLAPSIIHSNVKLANIRIGPDGVARLVGYRACQELSPQVKPSPNVRVVTPGFSPPESYGKGSVDIRSDVYGLGATTYAMLTGERLPESVQILSKDVPPPRPPNEINPQVSQRVNDAIERAVQLNQNDRFPSIDAFKSAISVSSSRPEPAPTQKRRRWALLLGGLLLVVALLVCVLAGGYYVVWPKIAVTATPTASYSPTSQLTSTATWTHTPPSPSETLATTVEPSPVSSSEQIEDDFGVPMILVPSGPFEMGTAYGAEDEAPAHIVTLDSYYIDLNEVTNARYAACVQDGGCDPPKSLNSATRPGYYGVSVYDDYPVIQISWDMARDYCEWREARLPSEAEWEKAARGSSEGIYPWGMEIDCSLANFWGGEDNCVGDTTAVGSYPQGASPYGVLDMAGNVWEWVMDWYDPGYYGVSPSGNPLGPESSQHRVMRGGSWSGGALQLRVTTRGRNLPNGTYNYVGFRCVRTP